MVCNGCGTTMPGRHWVVADGRVWCEACSPFVVLRLINEANPEPQEYDWENLRLVRRASAALSLVPPDPEE